jgi:cell division septum initiation protein DivIVA
MPDQNSAADEHALIQEITAPLTTLPDDPMPIVANVDFPMVLRGYDRLAVDAYVKKASQLVAELQATRSPEAAVRRALERVGEQISGILKRAHETAAEITAQSRREAEDRLEVARQEAAGIVAEAEGRVKRLDGDTDRIWVERQRIVDDVRGLSEELLALAQAAAERFPAGDEASAEPRDEAGVAVGEPEAVGETQAVGEPAVVESEPGVVQPEDRADPGEEATRRLSGEEASPSETDPTAVMPNIEELEVEPPRVFGDEQDRPR